MIAFAAMLAARSLDDTALAAYLTTASPADRAACDLLLSGTRPRRIAGMEALLHWSAEVAGIPDWLVAASVQASGDRAETAALLLPSPVGTPPKLTPPSLAEVTDRLARATRITAHATMIDLWQRLPPRANLVLNQLASGSFRATIATQPTVVGPSGSVLAVMIMAAAARPEITLALWRDGVPVPIARLPLTLPETPEVMAWIRANVAQRFGPLRQVPPVQVFRVGFAGLVQNPRRKSGYELQGAVIEAWLPNYSGTDADQLDVLSGLHNSL